MQTENLAAFYTKILKHMDWEKKWDKKYIAMTTLWNFYLWQIMEMTVIVFMAEIIWP